MALTFDRTNRLIIVPSPDTTLDVQTLYDECRDYEDEPRNLDLEPLVQGSGKEDLGGGAFVGITVKLINDWRLKFEDRPGLAVVQCVVSGGNLVASNSYGDNPIAPSTFTQVQIRQSTSPAAIDLTNLSALVQEFWQMAGLDIANPVFVPAEQGMLTTGAINIDVTGDSLTGHTLTRQ